jgi:hypothetical protein
MIFLCFQYRKTIFVFLYFLTNVKSYSLKNRLKKVSLTIPYAYTYYFSITYVYWYVSKEKCLEVGWRFVIPDVGG